MEPQRHFGLQPIVGVSLAGHQRRQSMDA